MGIGKDSPPSDGAESRVTGGGVLSPHSGFWGGFGALLLPSDLQGPFRDGTEPGQIPATTGKVWQHTESFNGK